jgi:hypothetical protein
MSKIALLLSGHVRNLDENIINFKDKLLNILEKNNYNYDIYIHTWDDNLTKDIIYNKDKFFQKNIINIPELFQKHKIPLKKIIIENQEKKTNELQLKNYLDKTCIKPYLNGKYNEKELRDLTKKLFWQFYGHYKVLEMIDNPNIYTHIIKTRPDLYYDFFDISLLQKNIFFPDSHRYNGICINQIFFGGKKEYMIKILQYFSTLIYNQNKEINDSIASTYKKSGITFNTLFKHYISNYLKFEVFYTKYNPKIYRNKNNINLIN